MNVKNIKCPLFYKLMAGLTLMGCSKFSSRYGIEYHQKNLNTEELGKVKSSDDLYKLLVFGMNRSLSDYDKEALLKLQIDTTRFILPNNNLDNTPIQSAVQSGDLALVKALVSDPDIDVNVGEDFLNPLYLASSEGRLDIVQALLSVPKIDVNGSEYDTSPLYIASKSGHFEVVKALISHPNIDVNQDTSGHTPLYAASRSGHFEVVKALISHPNIDVNQGTYSSTPLCAAAAGGHLEIVNVLLSAPDIDVNKQQYLSTALYIASELGHLEIVKALCSAPGIDVNKDTGGYTPLYIASKEGHLEVVKVLLSVPGINVNGIDIAEVKLRYSSESIHKMNVKKDKYLYTPLYIASKSGHLEVVKALCSASGIHLNEMHKCKSDPVYVAAQEGHVDIVEELLLVPSIAQQYEYVQTILNWKKDNPYIERALYVRKAAKLDNSKYSCNIL